MQFKDSKKIKWKTFLTAVGGWSLSALFASSFIILQDYASQRFHPLWQILLWQFATALGWLILTPFILWLVNNFPFGGGKLWRNILVQISIGLAIILTREAIDAYVQPLIGFPPNRIFGSYFESFRYIFVSDFHFSVITYCVALGLIFGTRYYKQFREREFQALHLKTRLAQARMHVLKMQLHPHFLFNTHNAIAELIYKDQEAAEMMLSNLSDLLRISLENLEVEKIRLKEELDFLEKYLQIEQTRFQDRLRVEFEIEPETLEAAVPNMILQPLVENAIKHGIAPLARGGTIEIRSFKNKNNLILQVCDDGNGVPFNNTAEIFERVGLSNTRSRLKYLYGDQNNFEIQPNGSKGLKVSLSIPFTNMLESVKDEKENKAERFYENPNFSY